MRLRRHPEPDADQTAPDGRANAGDQTRPKRRAIRKATALTGKATGKVGLATGKAGWRLRIQLAPLFVGGLAAAAGYLIHTSWHPLRHTGPVAGLLLGGVLVLALGAGLTTRHWLSRTAKALYAAASVAFVTIWISVAAHRGIGRPMGAWLIGGGTLLAAPWWWHFRVGYRPRFVEIVEPEDDPFAEMTDTYDEYVACEKGALPGTHLANFTGVAGGIGNSADIVLIRGQQTTTMALAAAERIASAYELPDTQTILEPHPRAIRNRARLTILNRDVLADERSWAGSTIDMATGDAIAAAYFDGQPARFRFFTPGSGAEHAIVAGNTGTGKSAFLNWIFATLTDPNRPVPITPVLIDPELGGQSVPAWKRLRHVAIGEDNAVRALRALNAICDDRAVTLGDRDQDYFDPTPEMPLIVAVIDELPVLTKESVHRQEVVRHLEALGKRGRKRGIALVLVLQVPSLEEMDSSTLRNMLRSGCIVCFKTGDSVNASMLGLHVDPSLLPEYFADGSKTQGLAIIKGPDGRQAPTRTIHIRKEDRPRLAEEAVECPLDEPAEALWQKFMTMPVAGGDGASATDPTGQAASVPAAGDLQATAEQRQTAAEAILEYLRDGAQRERHEIADAIRPVTTSMSTVKYGLKKLVEDGLVAHPTEKGKYWITEAGRSELQRRERVA